MLVRVGHLSHFHSLLAAERQAYFRTFLLASVAGVFSLFPLIFNPTGRVPLPRFHSAVTHAYLFSRRINYKGRLLNNMDRCCLYPPQSARI